MFCLQSAAYAKQSSYLGRALETCGASATEDVKLTCTKILKCHTQICFEYKRSGGAFAFYKNYNYDEIGLFHLEAIFAKNTKNIYIYIF